MQIEPRLLAYYMASGIDDHSLAAVYYEGGDVYRAVIAPIFNIMKDEVTEEQRQVGKTLVLSVMYGGGIRTIVRQLDVEPAYARALLLNFRREWPGMQNLSEEIKTTLRNKGYITTIAGRHLHPQEEHKALNALVQGSAAELMRDSLLKVHSWLNGWQFESHIVCTVHDDLMLDVASNELEAVVSYVPGLMKNPVIEEFVPIEVDVEVSSTTWAELERIESYKTLNLS